jgi:hypothetical protein
VRAPDEVRQRTERAEDLGGRREEGRDSHRRSTRA